MESVLVYFLTAPFPLLSILYMTPFSTIFNKISIYLRLDTFWAERCGKDRLGGGQAPRLGQAGGRSKIVCYEITQKITCSDSVIRLLFSSKSSAWRHSEAFCSCSSSPSSLNTLTSSDEQNSSGLSPDTLPMADEF